MARSTDLVAVLGRHDHHCRQDLVRSAGQQAKHPLRVVDIDGFAENLAVYDDNRVRGEDRAPGTGRQDGTCLLRCDAECVLPGILSRMDALVDGSRADLERNSGRGEELGAPRGGRRQYQDAAVQPAHSKPGRRRLEPRGLAGCPCGGRACRDSVPAQMDSLTKRVVDRLTNTRSGERTVALLMFAYSFLAMTSHNILKPVTKSKFIDQLGSDNLPYVLMARRSSSAC